MFLIKQARNPGTVEKRIANSGGPTDWTDRIDGIDGTLEIATDPMQSFYFMVFYVGRKVGRQVDKVGR